MAGQGINATARGVPQTAPFDEPCGGLLSAQLDIFLNFHAFWLGLSLKNCTELNWRALGGIGKAFGQLYHLAKNRLV